MRREQLRVERVTCFRVQAIGLKIGEGISCEDTKTGDGKSGHT